MEIITSLQNAKIKNLAKLAKNKERQAQGLFIIEGARELSLALLAHYEVVTIFIYPPLFNNSQYPTILDQVDPNCLIEVSEDVFSKIAYREGSDGLLTLARPKSHLLSDLTLSPNPFIILIESIEKPGNLGAILRTADAAKVDAVIVCDPNTDLYNPNVVRSGVGCLFTVPIAVCTSGEGLDFLRGHNIKSYAAELQASQWYHQADYTQGTAIVMGTEADGLTDFWLQNADARIKIPMRGAIDSLNVSASTAIITFEAMRQRGF